MRHFAIALSVLLTMYATSLMAIPAQVIIIPNAEIDPTGNLTQIGFERSGALAAYISLTPSLTTFGEPVSIFAARPIPNTPPNLPTDNTLACLQTVGPTALFLKLPIHPGYSKLQDAEIASFILNNPNYNDLNVLICWRPESIQSLAAAFGVASPPAFPANTYNVTWVITFSPTVALQTSPQHLLLGD